MACLQDLPVELLEKVLVLLNDPVSVRRARLDCVVVDGEIFSISFSSGAETSVIPRSIDHPALVFDYFERF